MGDSAVAVTLTKNVSRGHWKDFLASTRISNIGGIYDYLAKAEGRKTKTYKFACTAPRLTTKGEKIIGPAEKCGLLADFFQNKLADASGHQRTVATGSGLATKQHHLQQGYREALETPHIPFRLVEVRKAIRNLAKGQSSWARWATSGGVQAFATPSAKALRLL